MSHISLPSSRESVHVKALGNQIKSRNNSRTAQSPREKSIPSILARAKSTSITTEPKRKGSDTTSTRRKEISDTLTTSTPRRVLSRGIGARTAGLTSERLMNVKVGCLDYTVTQTAGENEEGRCGATLHQISEIRISPLLSEGQYRATLLHEVMHACAHFAGLEQEEKYSEEEWIGKLSPTLLMVLRDNPSLTEDLYA